MFIENILNNFGAITFSQVIGFIALIITVGSFQILSQKGMFAGRILGDVFWVIHYLMISGLTAAFSIVVGMIRTILIVFWNSRSKIFVIPISIFVVFIFCYLLPEQSLFKYVPFLAFISNSVSQYYHDNFMKCRSIMIFSPIMWFIYALYIGSYGGLIVSILMFLSHVIGMFRYIFKKKKELTV